MKLILLALSLFLLSTLAVGWLPTKLLAKNEARAALTTLYALKRARIQALIDTSHLGHADFVRVYNFRRIDGERLLRVYAPFYWQLQFHITGIYTKNSLSIYRDTPRFATTTDFDRRPLAGDILALSLANSQCLSGYNNTNLDRVCRDNALFDFRLKEASGLEVLRLIKPAFCQEKDTFRFYFRDDSSVFCGILPRELDTDAIVQVGRFYLRLSPKTGYAFIESKLP